MPRETFQSSTARASLKEYILFYPRSMLVENRRMLPEQLVSLVCAYDLLIVPPMNHDWIDASSHLGVHPQVPSYFTMFEPRVHYPTLSSFSSVQVRTFLVALPTGSPFKLSYLA